MNNDIIDDEDESTTGIVNIEAAKSDAMEKELEAKAKKISQKMKAVRRRVASSTEYKQINPRASRPK